MESRLVSTREETKAPPEMASEDWAQPNGKAWAFLPWTKLERHVYRLQKRIYRASNRGNVQAVHRLQQLLMRSRSAQLLAVRRVTQDNQGKNTPGIDGVASVQPAERLKMVEEIHPKNQKKRKATPVRRVWIPKPGKTEKRPLGIPTMEERARQALAKQALEPEWEAKFEPNSYGFRPGRSAHDAIVAIGALTNRKTKYVLDADIAGCFDHINHEALLAKLDTFPAMRQAIKGWLKAGVLEGQRFTATEEGTPQGGVISPLLANIALHGLETAVFNIWKNKERRAHLVRYADDFVATHYSLDGILKVRQVAEEWLKGMGLEMKPSKTRITHTLTPHEGNVGFDFLGFHIQQYPAGKTQSSRAPRTGKLLGFKVRIVPSKEAVKRHNREVNKAVRALQAAPQVALVEKLSPIIRGWTNYFGIYAGRDAFHVCDQALYNVLRRWALRRHPRKNRQWVFHKYWALENEGWKFKAPNGSWLRKHQDTSVKTPFRMMEGTASPFDGNLIYWAQRLADHPLTGTRAGKLLRLQKGRCAWCGLYFKDGDLLEVDHLIPRNLGGDERILNLQLLHRHCHDRKSAQDGSHPSKKAEGIQ